MLYYDRIGVSEEFGSNKASKSKECDGQSALFFKKRV